MSRPLVKFTSGQSVLALMPAARPPQKMVPGH